MFIVMLCALFRNVVFKISRRGFEVWDLSFNAIKASLLLLVDTKLPTPQILISVIDISSS